MPSRPRLRPTCRCLLSAIALAAVASAVHAATLAFPDAEGWGRNARGGRDEKAKILAVTSLADSGPGTLREALKTPGPRIVVFRTGGVIELTNKLTVQDGFLTIAAQTAPGDGVIVRGFPIRIAADHVIIRGLRIRNGDGPGPKGDLRDSIQIGRTDGKPIHDIIVDHCSFGWSVDETVEFYFSARNVTLSYNIFSEALWKSIHQKGSHGYAMLLGSGANEQITLHHNLFAHNERRNPWIKDNAQVELINNVIYNWGSEGTGLWSDPKLKPLKANVIGNFYKLSDATIARAKKPRRAIDLHKAPPPNSRIYLHDNVGPGREPLKDDWDAAGVGDYDPAPYRADKPLAEAASGLKPQKAVDAYSHVLKHAGAAPRDKADARAVEDTRTGGGRPIDKLDQVGGYPTYAAGTPPVDTDEDGLPDEWERAHGLNPRDRRDATHLAPSGYLHIEEYVNSLIPAVEAEAGK